MVDLLYQTLDPDKHSIPFYLNPESPFCKPLMSHNVKSHNVVLKVTVPKRTGRKRKKGSDGPWEGDVEIQDSEETASASQKIGSQARLDDPKSLKRKLEDNVGQYRVEAAGTVTHTHRFRGLADFYWDTGFRSDFAQRFTQQALPGDGKLAP